MTFQGLPGFTGDSLPLAPGSLFGFRAFDIIPETGALQGVSYPETWNEGENTATCALKNKEHSMSDCSHGYWSYFGITDAYLDTERVKAIIEGYGEVIVGEEGFRSQKAKIRAVVLPDPEEVVEEGARFKTLKTMLRRERMIFILRSLSVFLHLFSAFNVLIGSMKHVPSIENSTVSIAAYIGVSIVVAIFLFGAYLQKRHIKKSFKNWREHRKSHKEFRKSGKALTRESLASRVQNRYPDVKIYDDLGDMLSDYQGKIVLHGSLLGADATLTDPDLSDASGDTSKRL